MYYNHNYSLDCFEAIGSKMGGRMINDNGIKGIKLILYNEINNPKKIIDCVFKKFNNNYWHHSKVTLSQITIEITPVQSTRSFQMCHQFQLDYDGNRLESSLAIISVKEWNSCCLGIYHNVWVE